MITINWQNRIINVPQSYHVNLGGGIYEMDINQFRLSLKDLEDDEVGINFPTTHNHIASVTFGGVTLAKIIEIINGYTITFEDVGTPYVVNIVGANSNIPDVTNINNVSVRAFNSAGLVVSNSVTNDDLDAVKQEIITEVAKKLSLSQFLALK